MSCKNAKVAGFVAAAAMLLGSTQNAHALSGKLGDWTISLSGFALAEWWLTTDQVETNPDNGQAEGGFIENDVFVLHLIELGGTRPLYHDLQFEWKVGTRYTNGNYFSTGNGMWRDAYAGITGKFGSVKLGRFVTKSWLILDWPYGQSGINEYLSENGAADWSVSSAIRYSSPNIPLGPNGGMALEVTVGSGAIDFDSWGTNIEAFLGMGISGFNLDVIYQRTDGQNRIGQTGSGGHDGPGNGAFNGCQGWCAPSDGEDGDIWQHQLFVGARYGLKNGLQFHGSMRLNQWHNENGIQGKGFNPDGSPNFFPLFAGGVRDPNASIAGDLPTDLTNIQLTGTIAYGTGRWFFSGSYSHTLESMIDGVEAEGVGDTLDDQSGVISVKVQYNIGDLVFLYFIARHMMRYGDYIPAHTQPWQWNNTFNGDAQGDATRFILGTQALFF